MSSLIVLLPAAMRTDAAERFGTAPMMFALLGKGGEMLQSGQAPLDGLPVSADSTVLVVAARDVQLVLAKLPPVTGQRLQRILPNVVEERLLDDPQLCHIAIDPEPLPSGERCLAVVGRNWLAFILERFAQAGHRRLRAVPLIHCIPPAEATTGDAGGAGVALSAAGGLPDASPHAVVQPVADAMNSAEAGIAKVGPVAGTGGETQPGPAPDALSDLDPGPETEVAIPEAYVAPPGAPASALIVGGTAEEAQGGEERLELAVREGYLGFGLSLAAAHVDATLAGLASRYALTVWSLETGGPRAAGPHADAVPHQVHDAMPAALSGEDTGLLGGARPMSLVSLAARAVACRFDLCQFELANAGRRRLGAGGVRPWRVALALLGASVLVSIVAVNVEWFQLRHRRDALEAQMTQVVKSVFPHTVVMLDPHMQMASELARLAAGTGEVRPGDFLALAAGLARALGPVPSTAIAALDYSGDSLQVTFKTGAVVDEDGLKRRLTQNGMSVQEDDGKWTLRSGQSGPR